MMLPKEGCLLRVFVGESDRHSGRPLYEWIVLLPIVVEIVDARDKIEAFLASIDDNVTEGLVTLEKVEVRLYRSGRKEA